VSRRLASGSASVPGVEGLIAETTDTIAAYGPWWSNFRASARLEAHWRRSDSAVGMIVDVNELGYYALLPTPPKDGMVAFEFVKRNWERHMIGDHASDADC